MGDELFDPWFNESDIDAMRHGYDVPRTCFRAGWDLAQERIAELEAQLASAYRDKMHLEDTCNFQHEMLLSCQRERDALEKELLEERASYEAENQRLKEKLNNSHRVHPLNPLIR